jgi:hypothetical protein
MAVAVERQQKLIGGKWVGAKSGRECEQETGGTFGWGFSACSSRAG